MRWEAEVEVPGVWEGIQGRQDGMAGEDALSWGMSPSNLPSPPPEPRAKARSPWGEVVLSAAVFLGTPFPPEGPLSFPTYCSLRDLLYPLE